ncbi:MAG: outer membrane beta-barrel family protein [Bacteroidetes bacterium]|nr:outer membrane beta-barrel family protein [Bacteroidota bacterium]
MTRSKQLLFSILLILAANFAFSQQGLVELAVQVRNEKNERLPSSSIKVVQKGSNRLMAFKNADERTVVDFALRYTKPDTILVIASYTGYRSDTVELRVNKPQKFQLSFTLTIQPALKAVVVEADRAVWKSGDSTFFNVESFKEPGQRKLGEIIAGLPGFRINEKGVLLYKNQPVPKILIDGEELFADNTDLLLKNMPLHVIKYVQALEKQNLNKKLKGLTGDDQVFVNLALKKEHALVLFGDGEAGAGTLGRYLFNPVLFKLGSKAKFGNILNGNNYGRAASYQEQRQLKGDLYMDAEQGSMQSYLFGIQEFPTSRYIRNQLFDNRFQVNTFLGKKVSSVTEIAYVSDRQSQQNTDSSSIFSGNAFFNRNTMNQVHINPSLLQVSEKLRVDFNTKSSLEWKIGYTKDWSNAYSDNLVRQHGQQLFANSAIRNQFHSIGGALNYTSRMTAETAIQVDLQYGFYRLPQTLFGFSSSWKEPFGLPDSAYDQLHQSYLNSSLFAKGKAQFIRKKRKKAIPYNLFYDFRRTQLNTDLQFTATDAGLPPVWMPSYSHQGIYTIGTLQSGFAYPFKAMYLPFLLDVKGGLSMVDLEEEVKHKRVLMPVYDINVSQKSRWSKVAESNVNLVWNRSPRQIFALPSQLFPTGIAQYARHLQSTVPENRLSLNHFLSFTFPHSSLSVSQGGSIDFTPQVYRPAYSELVAINIDSVLKTTSTSSYNAYVDYIFPLVFIGTKVTWAGNINTGNRLSLVSDVVEKSKYISAGMSLKLQKNWNKKWFVTGQSDFVVFGNKLPASLKDQGFSKTTSWKNSLLVKGSFFKTYSGNISVEHYNNNSGVANATNILFADLELLKSIPAHKLNIRLKVENLFDKREFLLIYRDNPLYQTFGRTPLVGRNIFLSLRMEF